MDIKKDFDYWVQKLNNNPYCLDVWEYDYRIYKNVKTKEKY